MACDCGLYGTLRGHQNDRNRRVDLANVLDEIETSSIRHVNVAQNGVDAARSRHFQRF